MGTNKEKETAYESFSLRRRQSSGSDEKTENFLARRSGTIGGDSCSDSECKHNNNISHSGNNISGND